MKWSKKQREKERERERRRMRKEKQTDGQRHRWTDREVASQTNRQTDSEIW